MNDNTNNIILLAYVEQAVGIRPSWLKALAVNGASHLAKLGSPLPAQKCIKGVELPRNGASSMRNLLLLIIRVLQIKHVFTDADFTTYTRSEYITV